VAPRPVAVGLATRAGRRLRRTPPRPAAPQGTIRIGPQERDRTFRRPGRADPRRPGRGEHAKRATRRLARSTGRRPGIAPAVRGSLTRASSRSNTSYVGYRLFPIYPLVCSNRGMGVSGDRQVRPAGRSRTGPPA
jgi:hypothetical protein